MRRHDDDEDPFLGSGRDSTPPPKRSGARSPMRQKVFDRMKRMQKGDWIDIAFPDRTSDQTQSSLCSLAAKIEKVSDKKFTTRKNDDGDSIRLWRTV